jgi:hypothetical protein
MRDGEHIRHGMQQRFRDVLADQPVPWLEVHGDVPTRVQRSVPAIQVAAARGAQFAVPLQLRPWDEQVALWTAGEQP